jgi:hypothetical protein
MQRRGGSGHREVRQNLFFGIRKDLVQKMENRHQERGVPQPAKAVDQYFLGD